MRTSKIAAVSVLVGAAGVLGSIAGCEDGPSQTYAPTPGAGQFWNNGDDASTTDPGSRDFDAGGGGTNAVNICTAAEQNAAWTKAFNAPIIPPFSVGGIDLSTGGTFNPFTIEMAQRGVTTGKFLSPKLCQGSPVGGGCSDGSGNPGYAWGPAGQLQTCYDVATHQLSFFSMQPGYDGELKMKLPATFNGVPVVKAVDQDGKAGELNFVWHIGQPITENGKVLRLGWTGGGIDPVVANKIYLALMLTFQPTLLTPDEIADPAYDCLVATKCRTSANPDGSGGNFGARPVGIYFDALQSNSSNPGTAGSPSDIYIFPVKFVPYSLKPYNLGLDTFISANTDPALKYKGKPIYGPYSPAGVLSPKGAPTTPFCTLYMGSTFGEFVKNCINTTGDSAIDHLSLAKLLGGQHHTAEWFTFSVVGVNQNFSGDDVELTQGGLPSVLPDTAGTLDNPPHDDDVATDFIVDVRAAGKVLNDMRGNQDPAIPGVTKLEKYEDKSLGGQDLHGTAAILGYFRQLTYDDLKKQMLTVGITPQADPKSCWLDSTKFTGDPSTWSAPTGCSGFEQMQTPALGSATGTAWTDILDVGPKVLHPRTIFRPGDPTLQFMADPVNGVGKNAFIPANNLMQAALSQVTFVLGHGKLEALPPAARDWRYYLQFYARAYVKYMLNRSVDPTWQQLYADDSATVHTLRQINTDQLFFDLQNGLDKFEYIDREPANQLGAPVDLEYDILLTTSNTQDINFFQRLEREEKALYASMLTDKTKAPGSNENVNLSDLFGSPAIVGIGLAGATDKDGKPIPGKDAWYCATKVPTDADCPNGAPTDASGALLVDGLGRPLFTNYRGIFSPTQWAIGGQIPINKVMPDIASALVDVPNYANPYDQTSANTPLTTIVPHFPYAPGNGFEIPINAERSQFIQTGALDFSGVTITMNVDYLPNYDAKTHALTSGTIAAVETQDFLGEIFPCVDPSTGDILRVRMYSSVLEIQSWLDSHPAARSACNIFIRQSPYNNYPDYVISVTNGVLLGINPGAGGGPGRISDVTLFNPALLTATL